jgi:hypothetical protein
MTTSLSLIVLSLGFQGLAAQDPGTKLEDVIRRYEKGILRIEGVKEIAPDEGKGAIAVRVETPEARDMVLFVTREKLEGYPVRVVLSKDPLSSQPGPKPSDRKEPAGDRACGHCAIHCPTGSDGKSKEGRGTAKDKAPASTSSDSSKKPEPSCSHCLLHCKPIEDHATVVEPGPAGTPPPTPPPSAGAEQTPDADVRCDVARKLRALPPLKTGRSGCEEMLSTSNNPDKIRWAIEKSLPHWVSKDMPGTKGNGRDGVPCAAHGNHSTSEFVCYSWVKHGRSCPMKDTLSPKDLVPPGKKGSE